MGNGWNWGVVLTVFIHNGLCQTKAVAFHKRKRSGDCIARSWDKMTRWMLEE